MVYDWEGKRDICYKMYIEEKKALEDIMEHMKTVHGFAPSKRAFQTQFKRWGFPSKQNPAHKNAELVSRIRELWETNTSQRDMLRILNEEGYAIKERELMRVRSKNRWLLRVPNGTKSARESVGPLTGAEEGVSPDMGAMEGSSVDPGQAAAVYNTGYGAPSAAGTPDVVVERQERLARLQAESDERWAAKKRRRRTRGWAGLPADPPGPPRFPSETTLDESKTFLSLDDTTYRQLRDDFQRICQEAGFIKKTIAGPEKWQAAKDRLIRESQHLQTVFWVNTTRLDLKNLALDVVCTDVTKRMRTLETRMTIAEAKNALGINPEQSRQIRTAFYDTLKSDHFTSKLEMGNDRWKQLKERWIQDSELLQHILAPGPADPQHAVKVRAIEVLCRDVMKRLRDDQAKRDPTKKRPSRPSLPSQRNQAPHVNNTAAAAFSQGASTLASQALASTRMAGGDLGGFQIDPSLIQAATNDPSFALAQHHHDQQQQHQHQQHQQQHPQQQQQPQQQVAQPYGFTHALMPTPVYLRVHSQSQVHQNAKTWIATLNTHSVAELRMLALSRFKDARVARIEGTLKDETGRDMSFLVTEDHELDAYLEHVQGRTATFLFLLQSAQ